MKFKTYKPLVPEQMSQIMDLQARHMIVLLLRLDFTKHDYLNGLIRYNFASLKRCFIWTTFNWTVILFLAAVCLGYFPNYSVINGKASGIANYSMFAATIMAAFILMEYIWFTNFYSQVRIGRSKALDLVFHYVDVLDRELREMDRLELIGWFRKRFSLIQMYFKWTSAGLGMNVLMACSLMMQECWKGTIYLWEMVLYVYVLGKF